MEFKASTERKVAIYFDSDALLRLADMLCVPAEELDEYSHELRAEQLVAYHIQHGLEAELMALLEIYRPGVFL